MTTAGHGLVAVQVWSDAESVQGLGQEAAHRLDEADIGAAQGGVQLRYRDDIPTLVQAPLPFRLWTDTPPGAT